jgi:protein YIPF5/7
MLQNSVMMSSPPPTGSSAGADEWYSQSGGTGRETPTVWHDAQANFSATGFGEDEDDDEIPLLEELGVRPEQILVKLRTVLNVTQKVERAQLEDADLAGPILLCFVLGVTFLLHGRLSYFGYVYGFSVIGALLLHMIISLIHGGEGLKFSLTASVLGYSLLPVILLAALSILMSLQGVLGIILSVGAIAWSVHSSMKMLDAKLSLSEVKVWWLVCYPVALLYSCFVLISVF